jgi:hypothetical protein
MQNCWSIKSIFLERAEMAIERKILYAIIFDVYWLSDDKLEVDQPSRLATGHLAMFSFNNYRK